MGRVASQLDAPFSVDASIAFFMLLGSLSTQLLLLHPVVCGVSQLVPSLQVVLPSPPVGMCGTVTESERPGEL